MLSVRCSPLQQVKTVLEPDHTFYKQLGVTPEASEADIKKVYRKLVLKHHPDKGGDPKVFDEITDAHNVLSDPKRKLMYDEILKVSAEGTFSGHNRYLGLRAQAGTHEKFDLVANDWPDTKGDLKTVNDFLYSKNSTLVTGDKSFFREISPENFNIKNIPADEIVGGGFGNASTRALRVEMRAQAPLVNLGKAPQFPIIKRPIVAPGKIKIRPRGRFGLVSENLLLERLSELYKVLFERERIFIQLAASADTAKNRDG